MQTLFHDIQMAAAELARTAPPGLALFEYWDLLFAKTGGAPPRDLFAAAAVGDVHTTRALSRQWSNVDVDAQDTDGMTTMYIAAAHGHTELVEVLADEGNADVNLGTFEDSTLQLVEAWKDDPPGEHVDGLKHGAVFPLYIAARNGKVDTIRALLKRGAAVDQETDCDETSLHGASRDGRSEVIKLLLDHGADVDKAEGNGMTPMHAASAGGHAGAVTVLLAAGAATDVRTIWSTTAAGYRSEAPDGYRSTPFHAAAEQGHSKIITLLLDHGGVDIEHCSGESGLTALTIASDRGHVEAVKLLLGRGADANKADNNGGYIPLWCAARGGYVEVLKVLLDCGGDVNMVGNNGQTPLCAAAEGGHVAAIKLLLGRGADIDTAEDDGDTPVHSASGNGEAEAVHVLLKAGADANLVGNYDVAALHTAAEYGYMDVVRVLTERWPTNPLAWRMFLMGGGAASELQDYVAPPANRTTRNHLPRLYSKPDMMKEVYTYLYKPRYADLDQTDGAGNTALQVAEAGGNQDVATLLRELSLG
jgi:ankyrin repeat protein